MSAAMTEKESRENEKRFKDGDDISKDSLA